MLDTIKINLLIPSECITGLLHGKYKFVPTKDLVSKLGYLPFIWFHKAEDGFTKCVIECSVPKVVFDSNYFEIDENRYRPFLIRLSSKLEMLGLLVTADQLSKAKLSAVTFSFNIVQAHFTADVINYLGKLSLSGVGKQSQTKYKQFFEMTESGVVRHFNKSTSCGFYDKTYQLTNLEEKQTPTESKVVQDLMNGLLPRKILRFEVVLQNSGSLRSHFSSRIGKKEFYLIQDIFNKKLAQNILLKYYQKIYKSLSLISLQDGSRNYSEFFAQSLKSGNSLRVTYSLLGYAILSQELGDTKLNKMIDAEYDRSNRYKAHNDLRALGKNIKLESTPLRRILDTGLRQLNKFDLITVQEQQALQEFLFSHTLLSTRDKDVKTSEQWLDVLKEHFSELKLKIEHKLYEGLLMSEKQASLAIYDGREDMEADNPKNYER